MKSVRIFRSLSQISRCLVVVWSAVTFSSTAMGQVNDFQVVQNDEADKETALPRLAPGEKPPSTLIEISEEPKTIDPATLIPEKLTKRVTVSFKEQPLRDIVKWMQEEQSLNVLVDSAAMADEGILAGEPITDHSDDAPLFFLLNRLENMMLDWYFEDDTLFITTKTAADEHLTTIPYNLGDLFDNGHKPGIILLMIRESVPGKWEEVDGDGGVMEMLGDVLFVRQTFSAHQHLAGLLAAIRKHGRRTLVLDPPQHQAIRDKLNTNVTVQFQETPLNAAIREISRLVDIDIRLDFRSMSDEGISERIPITLTMVDRPLSSVFRAMLLNSLLTWRLSNNVLWITTSTVESEGMITAVFDVRDLCRNQRESNGLMRAIRTQTGGKWEEVDGNGGRMICPKPGVLVARQTNKTMDELSKLLERYRAALRISKPRDAAEEDPKELIVKYYRMQKDTATDVEKVLPDLIQPESWKSPANPDSTGTIRLVTSTSGLLGANEPDPRSRSTTIVVSNAVLIIRQTRENHEAIEKILQRITNGDPRPPSGMGGGMGGGAMGGGMGGGGMGGGGMGGGGFGGGFFSIPKK